MDTPRQSKSHLSKNLLQMKFMQRSAMRVQTEDYVLEQRRHIDDEHWQLDIPELAQKQSKYVIEQSYVFCEGLRFGRMSFKGFNPEIEKLMLAQDEESGLAEADRREKEIGVADEEMAARYTTLFGTVAKKFVKKRDRSEAAEDSESDNLGDGELVKSEKEPSPHSQKRWKKDRRPGKNTSDRGKARYF